MGKKTDAAGPPDMQPTLDFTLRLTNRQLHLIYRGLTGVLSSGERNEAAELAVGILDRRATLLAEVAVVAEKAIRGAVAVRDKIRDEGREANRKRSEPDPTQAELDRNAAATREQEEALAVGEISAEDEAALQKEVAERLESDNYMDVEADAIRRGLRKG